MRVNREAAEFVASTDLVVPMMGAVRTSSVKLKIFIAVVGAIAVQMMDYFRGQEFTTKAFFHDFAMKVDDPTIAIPSGVAIQEEGRVSSPTASLVASQAQHLVGDALWACQLHSFKAVHDGATLGVQHSRDFQRAFSAGVERSNHIPVNRTVVFTRDRIAVKSQASLMFLTQTATVGCCFASINSAARHSIGA